MAQPVLPTPQEQAAQTIQLLTEVLTAIRLTNELLRRIPVDTQLGAVVTYDCSGNPER